MVKDSKKAKHKRKSWSDADKEHAIALYVTTGNLSHVYRETGVPISTLRGWLAEQPPEKIREAREEAQVGFVRKAWEAVTAHVEHLAEKSAIAATTARDSATIVGILVDKIQLVTGQPTANLKQQVDGQVIDRHEYDITHRIEQYADVYAKLATRRGIFEGSDAGNDPGESLDTPRANP